MRGKTEASFFAIAIALTAITTSYGSHEDDDSSSPTDAPAPAIVGVVRPAYETLPCTFLTPHIVESCT
jgi:hypothetical protein